MAENSPERVPCTHDWRPYSNLPSGESPGRHYQCGLCKIVGHTKQGMIKPTRKVKVFPYKCSATSCHKWAVDRIPGRGTRGALLWGCREHKDAKSDAAS